VSGRGRRPRAETLLTRRVLAALPDLPAQAGPVNSGTVSKWERDGMPVAVRGRGGRASLYREADCRAWLVAREAAAKKGAIVDVARERARKEHWQAVLARQTYRAREKELLPRAEVERAWSALVAAVRAKLLAVPAAHADRVHRAATLEGLPGVERALQEGIRDVLREMAGEGDASTEPARPRRGGRRVA
jgi:phage terminase Nu1 subunit (DNA packaging protein)